MPIEEINGGNQFTSSDPVTADIFNTILAAIEELYEK